MSENSPETSTFSRSACFEDFFDDSKKQNKNYKNDRNTIEKNQQEFGNRKRIKP
jgi:hypothetical protein